MRVTKYLQLSLLSCFSLLAFFTSSLAQVNWNPAHAVGTITGKYNFSTTQTPDQLVEIQPAVTTVGRGPSFQWEQSSLPLSGFTSISGATLTSYSFSGPLSNTTYYRRKTTVGLFSIYSNVVKISIGSSNWEDINYIREHDVLTTGISTWTAVDQLAIGSKLQSTTYLDGLGRSTEKVSRETATPAVANGLWGDMVQFSQYDAYGRQPVNYLPYTTTSQSGKFKTGQATEQPQYYTTNYNESSAYSSITFDNSPLNRVMNVKQPGIAWASGAGNSAIYDVNDGTDDVKIFSSNYIQGNAPVYNGTYAAYTLYKLSTLDENGKKVIEYTDKSGKLILRKVQLDDVPANFYTGWICTYNVYDDFGLLRFQLMPEAVKYLAANNWSFAGTNGALILAEQCFQYDYDEKGRTTWKKAPGAQPLKMIYDIRDRVVFMQDGNQSALATTQWTANIYDELDRPLISTLYNTTKTVSQLQADINSAAISSTVTITNPGTVSVTANTYLNPVSSASLNSSTTTTILKYVFYDNYSFNAVKTFNTGYTNTTAYSTADPNVQAIATSLRTTSMPTGSMTRVLGTTTFLSSTSYYDERGAQIQSLEDNIKAGTDITTLQYHFDGRVLSSCNDHTTPGTGYTNYKTLNKYLFDKLGRVTSIQKQLGSNAFKTIATYDYDDVGRLKTKHLDPGYTAGGNADLESLNYSYNIHNQITGINKDYALKNPANYNKWGHFFGLYLGFDNRDNIFSNANLTGQVTGLLWNTQGDDAQRKYDYTYDNAGRLTNAAFKQKQHTGDAWDNTKMDFSISGTSGKITYDLNGNLLNMLHKGVLPGTSTAITVDNLTYAYSSYSNKLQSVTDGMTNTTVNGQFGDFKDGTNGSTPDYVYDNNGNLVIDLNKNAKDLANVAGANGIQYNFLDKPELIRIAGKGTIQIVYSADGEKLQRSFTPEPSGAVITTSYINQYIYQESSAGGGLVLQSINFEEGRIRIISPTSQGNGLDALTVDGNFDLPNSKRGVWDYFVMDYQQNVRMILTGEIHEASNTATMEPSRATLEESIFGQAGAANELATTRFSPTPAGWTGNTSANVSRLGTNSGHNIGPNSLQKVMAGDLVTAGVNYYHQGTAGGNNNNFLNTVTGSLLSAISGGGGVANLVKGNAGNITTQLSSVNGFLNAVQPGGSNPSSTVPQAYLTILFFDERFNFIEASDGGVSQEQVQASVGSNGAPLALPNVKAPKNGYAYIYISNQSNNDVYFDDLYVRIEQGNIAEENHYYAYGLKIATLSSKKLGDVYEGALKNNYLYNDKEFFDDADLNWYDYGFRNYDPQIGRFTQLDPLTHSYPYLTPYQYASCDPITNIDIDGLEGGDAVVKSVTTALNETANAAGKLIENVVLKSIPRTTSRIATVLSKGNATVFLLSKVAKVSAIINTSITTQNVLNRASTDNTFVKHNLDNRSGSTQEYGIVFSGEDGQGDGGGRKGRVSKKDGNPVPIDGLVPAMSGIAKLSEIGKAAEAFMTTAEGVHVLHKEGLLGEEESELAESPANQKPEYIYIQKVYQNFTWDSVKRETQGGFYDESWDSSRYYYVFPGKKFDVPDTMIKVTVPNNKKTSPVLKKLNKKP